MTGIPKAETDIMDQFTKKIAEAAKWTDERGEAFIKQLIQSGDIFLVERQNHGFVTENDFPKSKTYNYTTENLWCYEPYREAKRLRAQLQIAKAALKDIEKEADHEGSTLRGSDQCVLCVCQKALDQMGVDITTELGSCNYRQGEVNDTIGHR